MIDRYQLRYFLAVVDTGGFSKAAESVNVTQPTLSIGIGKLERELGARLFDRDSKRVHLTDAGARLLEHARAIEHGFNLAAKSVSGAQALRRVRIGVLSSIATTIVESIVTNYRTQGDAGPIELIEGTERDLAGRLQRGRIDLALTVLRAGDDQFAHEKLFAESYSLALPRTHRFAHCRSVRAEDLADEVMIVRRHCEALPEISRHFTAHGVRPAFSLRTTNDDKALAMVRAGLGVTVMPDSFRDPKVSRPALADFDLGRTIGLRFADHAHDLMGDAVAIVAAVRQAVMHRPG